MFASDVEQYLLYTSRVEIRPSFSNFANVYKSSFIPTFARSKQPIEQFQKNCKAAFCREALKKLDKKDFDLDGHLVHWVDIENKGLELARDEAEQRLRRLREEATWETFELETNIVATCIKKRQAESSMAESSTGTRKQRRNEESSMETEIINEDKLDKTSEKLEHNRSVEILVPEAVDDEAHEVSEESVVPLPAVYFLDALLSDTSSINDSTYTGATGTTTTRSNASKKTTKYMWTFSLSELDVIVTEKVEMATTNNEIKEIYVSCHEIASSGNLKRHDHEKKTECLWSF